MFFHLHPSRTQRAILAAILLAGLLCITLLPLSLPIKIFLIAIFLAQFIYAFYQTQSIASLRHLEAQSWQWTMRNQQSNMGELQGDSLVTPWAMILRFKKTAQTIIIFKDHLGQEKYRQLLVHLRTS